VSADGLMKTRSPNAALVELVTADLSTARAPAVRMHQHQELIGHQVARLLADQRFEVTPQQGVQTGPLLARKTSGPPQKLLIN